MPTEDDLRPLAGQRVLVVEDESTIAMLLETFLEELGCQILASATHVEEALEAASKLNLDFAILDLNLNGQSSEIVAAVLAERGVPFIFSTGYGHSAVPATFRGRPVLAKPYSLAELEQAAIQIANSAVSDQSSFPTAVTTTS